MTPRRGKAFVWVTWITGLLAGTEQCAWKAWVKSKYVYEKKKDADPRGEQRLKEWMALHDAMTQNRAARLTQKGWEVRVEDQNAFKLEGENAILSGKPDLVALRPDLRDALIIDQKSGKRKDEQYTWQVLLYMFALLLTGLRGWHISGEVEYQDNVILSVKSVQMNAENQNRMIKMMQLVSGPEEPKRVPSPHECRYCDIIECPDRYQETTTDVRHLF